jgi:threonine/homoserine/homoserine lactone efflux protein
VTKDTLVALTIFAFVSSITPGPNNAMLMASGVNFGLRRTLPHALGVNIGFLFLTLSIGVGLQGLFLTVPLLYQVLRWGGAAYLVYLAWKIATAETGASAANAKTQTARPMSFLQAIAFQWINPKAWIMAATAITTYSSSDHRFRDLAIITALFALINVPCIMAWTVSGVALRRVLNEPIALRVFNITMGALLILSLYPMINSAVR